MKILILLEKGNLEGKKEKPLKTNCFNGFIVGPDGLEPPTL